MNAQWYAVALAGGLTPAMNFKKSARICPIVFHASIIPQDHRGQSKIKKHSVQAFTPPPLPGPVLLLGGCSVQLNDDLLQHAPPAQLHLKHPTQSPTTPLTATSRSQNRRSQPDAAPTTSLPKLLEIRQQTPRGKMSPLRLHGPKNRVSKPRSKFT